MVFFEVLAGRVTVVWAVPEEHPRVTGSPGSVWLAEKAQLVALVTEVASTTCPPAPVREPGVAVNDEIDGGGVAASLTVRCLVFVPEAPWAVRVNLYRTTLEVALAGRLIEAENEEHGTV